MFKLCRACLDIGGAGGRERENLVWMLGGGAGERERIMLYRSSLDIGRGEGGGWSSSSTYCIPRRSR